MFSVLEEELCISEDSEVFLGKGGDNRMEFVKYVMFLLFKF